MKARVGLGILGIVFVAACHKAEPVASSHHQAASAGQPPTTFHVSCRATHTFTLITQHDFTWVVEGDVTGDLQDDGTYDLTGGELTVEHPQGSNLEKLANIVVSSGTYNPATEQVTYQATQGRFAPTITYDGVAHESKVTDGPFGSPTLKTDCDISVELGTVPADPATNASGS
jgi:hypothetical protein